MTRLAEEFARLHPDAENIVGVPGASHAMFMQFAQKRLIEMARSGEHYEGPPVPRPRPVRRDTLPPPAGPLACSTPSVGPEPADPVQRSLF